MSKEMSSSRWVDLVFRTNSQIPPRHLIEGPLQSIRSTHCPDLQTQTLALLQAADDLEQVARLRVAVRPQHPHQALGRLVGHSDLGERLSEATGELQSALGRITQLQQQVDWFKRQLFGRTSEKRLEFDEVEQANLFAALGIETPPDREIPTQEIRYRRREKRRDGALCRLILGQPKARRRSSAASIMRRPKPCRRWSGDTAR